MAHIICYFLNNLLTNYKKIPYYPDATFLVVFFLSRAEPRPSVEERKRDNQEASGQALGLG